MKPERNKHKKESGAAPTPAPAALTDEDREAIEAMGQSLDGATACQLDDAFEAERAQAEVQTSEDELADALAAANARAEEYLNLAQRVQADFDNYRRRNQNVRSEAFEDGARAFAATLLPVMDNLERAVSAADGTADASLKEGVEMVLRQLSEAFAKRGVTAIDRKGEAFNPNLENAVMQGTPEDGQPGTVCEVFQKGYQMGGCVLRHAMVKVVPE
jgi:molecular chaperone GrpE